MQILSKRGGVGVGRGFVLLALPAFLPSVIIIIIIFLTKIRGLFPLRSTTGLACVFLFLSNRSKVTMVYRLINHAGCY